LLQPDSPIPLYHQLKQLLLAQLESGRWAAGDCMPGDQDLQRFFGVSRTTVRQAMRELELAGLITRHRGRGTFVALPKVSHGPEAPHRLSHTLRARGINPGWLLLEMASVPAPLLVASVLGLDEGSFVLRTSRLRLAGQEPIGHLVAHANASPELVSRENLLCGDSFHYLESSGLLAGARAERVLEAVVCDATEGSLLGIETGAPLLRVRRILFGADGAPLEHFVGSYRGDRFQYLASGNLPSSHD
jgi:GntR family transcriptional regulator